MWLIEQSVRWYSFCICSSFMIVRLNAHSPPSFLFSAVSSGPRHGSWRSLQGLIRTHWRLQRLISESLLPSSHAGSWSPPVPAMLAWAAGSQACSHCGHPRELDDLAPVRDLEKDLVAPGSRRLGPAMPGRMKVAGAAGGALKHLEKPIGFQDRFQETIGNRYRNDGV